MDKSIVKDSLKKIIKNNSDESGWMSLADLGGKLKEVGIDYNALGHYKLTNFVEAHLDLLQIRKDNSHQLPVYYVKLKSISQRKNDKSSVSSSPKHALTNWAYLKHYNTTLEKLKDFSLAERWYFKKKNQEYPYPILSNYLRYTFYRLTKEKKILKSEKYSAFNTGLVDKRYEPIHALFEKNQNYSQEWKLVDFCIPGEGFAGKQLVRNFREMPKRAHYFNDVTEILYDTRAGEPELDMQHIIIDNSHRLPLSFLSENPPQNFPLKNPELLSIEDRNKYYMNLSKAIENDNKAYRYLTNRLKDAIALSIKRVEWNFKTAIPMYYPRLDKMSLLLPLSLVDDDIVDVALVVENTKSGNYIGHTILPLNWAYSNARLITRPDSDWLVADQIETDADSEEDDE